MDNQVVPMAKCPKCGKDIAKAEKKWTLAPKGKKPITVGLYKCAGCTSYFRAATK